MTRNLQTKNHHFAAKQVARLTVAAVTTALLFAFTACDSSVTIQANKDSSSNISIDADIGKTVYNTIKAVTAGINMMNDSAIQAANAAAESSKTDNTKASGTKPTASQTELPIFSAADIKEGLSAGDITNISVSTPSNTAVSIKGTLPAPANQKAVLDGKGIKLANFITCTKNSLTVILSPETMRSIAASLPEDTKSYLDLLMAPVFTGEEMSASEYEDLVAAVYGDDMKKEIASSTVKITLVTPAGNTLKRSALADAKNVKTSGDRAVFSIPLAEFLTLQSAQTFSISW